MKKINCGDPDAIIAYLREFEGQKILVILNLSDTEQSIQMTDPSLYGNPWNVFMGAREKLSAEKWKMEPWGYVVYEYGEEEIVKSQ